VTTEAREERFRALYGAARSRIVAYALRRTASPDDAADIVAETFTIVWRRLEDIPAGEKEILWCYATARRVIANHRRRTQRRGELIDRIGVELGRVLSSQIDVTNEDVLVARTAFRHLGDEDREVLMLVGWEGLSSAQLGVVLGCSATAARIRLHRARSRLLAEMALLGIGVKQPGQYGHLPLRRHVPEKTPGEV
jgi:RNA polymerase sigma-70 factor (ECF subfamily)